MTRAAQLTLSALFALLIATLAILSVAAPTPGAPLTFVVPAGASLRVVADSLDALGVVRAGRLFELYARARGASARIKAGRYELEQPSSWSSVVGRLTRGEVVTNPLTIPEGFTLRQIASRIAAVSDMRVESVMAELASDPLVTEMSVPGPGLEGYLFPDTYRFAAGVPVRTMVEAMVDRYRDVWTADRRVKLEASGLTERELVTLASIVQAEARRIEEMPRIAGVYRNRLELGWLLQADPTVLYALGGYRERLLFAAIDSVADHPYNTYAFPGLPPGPIGSPGEEAIDAALGPTGDFLYFVAWPDGTHVFTRSLADHNEAREAARRARLQDGGADD